MKPIQRERFDRAVKKVLSLATPSGPDAAALAEGAAGAGYQHRIVVKDGGSIRIIPATDILYLEADDDYVRIFTPGAKFLKKATLTRLENSLDPQQFVRVHRSYLIPVSSVAKIEPYEKESHLAILHSGARVPVSKAGLARLREVLRW
jgi:two-component system LytT family response regulator